MRTGSAPTHAGAFHARLELLTAALDRAAANRPAILAMLQVAHATVIIAEEGRFFLELIGALAGESLVAIVDVHRGSLRAIQYARSLSKQVRAVSVVTSPEERERIRRRWERFPEVTAGVELILIDYDFRDVLDPLVEYIEWVNNEEFPDELVTVVIPEFIPRSLAARALHNRTAALLQARLRRYEDIALIYVPHHL